MKIEKLFGEIKNNIWGGMKLKEKYGKTGTTEPFAESWDLSFHPSGKTKISTGETLESVVTKESLGTNLSSFDRFPVLNKFIDAKDNLSLQVHPSDGYALKNENSYGKTEMWYIVEAEEGAGIYLGFKKDTTKEAYERAIKENTLTDLLKFYEVKAGESYFIPSGTVHAIGTGCLIYEIQQNSDLTYRVYDYDRRDKFGNPRELHIEKALLVSDLKKYENKIQTGDVIGRSKYFTVTKKEINGTYTDKTDGTTFKALTALSGNGKIDGQTVNVGDTFFIPADYGSFTLTGNMTAVITEIRKYNAKMDAKNAYITDDLGNIIVSAKLGNNVGNTIDKLLSSLNMSRADIE